jgi:hypothetical protein
MHRTVTPEVAGSSPVILAFHVALGVFEVWRFDGEAAQVIIEPLGNDGSYHPAEASGFLPIRAQVLQRWVVDEDARNESAWARRVRAWIRDELIAR